MEWTRKKYNENYNAYMPWIEDKILGYWGENKASYITKDTLSKDVTGNKDVNAVQGGIAEGVGGTLSSRGVLGDVGDATSKEGVNRVEHGNLEVNSRKKGWTETLSGGYLGGGK